MIVSGPTLLVNLLFSSYLKDVPQLSGDVIRLSLLVAVSLVLFVATAIMQASFLSYAYLFFAPAAGENRPP